MGGKSEFEVTGNMRDWDRWDRLHEIKVKTLAIGARYDEMDPEDMKKMATLMPNATSFICENGSHLDGGATSMNRTSENPSHSLEFESFADEFSWLYPDTSVHIVSVHSTFIHTPSFIKVM